MFADFVAVDLRHPSHAGWTRDDFLNVLFLGTSSGDVVGTWVQGKKVYGYMHNGGKNA